MGMVGTRNRKGKEEEEEGAATLLLSDLFYEG
jgi:hypothetical protein